MNKYIILFMASLVTLFASCTDVIDIDLLKPASDNLVVEGLITNYSGTQTITLSLSQPYMDNSSPRPAKGATVTLEEDGGGNAIVFQENTTIQGAYTIASYTPTIGKNYVLKINYGGESYIASCTMKNPIIVDKIEYFYGSSGGMGPGSGGANKGSYTFTVTVTDPLGEGDRYQLRTYFNDVLQTSQERIKIKTDEPNSQESIPDGLIFSFTLNGDESLTDEGVSPSVQIDFLSIDDIAYNFFDQLRNQSRNGLFSPPDANLVGNIKNINSNGVKALGLFIISPIVILRADNLNQQSGVFVQKYPTVTP